jgi:hypothetical protein
MAHQCLDEMNRLVCLFCLGDEPSAEAMEKPETVSRAGVWKK